MNVIYHYKVKSKTLVLPKGLVFVDPYNGKQYITDGKTSILQVAGQVNASRPDELKLSEDYAIELITAYYVEQRPSQAILDAHFTPSIALPSVGQTLSYARAVAYDMLKRKYTPIQQRQERAKKCLKCSFHVKHQSKMFVPQVLTNLMKTGDYTEEASLGQCNICGCPMQGKVKFSIDAVMASIEPEQIGTLIKTKGPDAFDTCWILSEAKNMPVLEGKLKNSGVDGAIGMLTASKAQKTYLNTTPVAQTTKPIVAQVEILPEPQEKKRRGRKKQTNK